MITLALIVAKTISTMYSV